MLHGPDPRQQHASRLCANDVQDRVSTFGLCARRMMADRARAMGKPLPGTLPCFAPGKVCNACQSARGHGLTMRFRAF